MIELENEPIVLEIRELFNSIEKAMEEADVYCDLMKQMFLSTSGKN